VASHGGGTLPFLAGRLDAIWQSDAALRQRTRGRPSEALGRLYLDIVLYRRGAMRAAADLVGPERLVFGTDHPFTQPDVAAELETVSTTFEAGDRQSILGGAAASLFRLI